MPCRCVKRLLHRRELVGLLAAGPCLRVRLGHHEIEEREVIAEGEDALGLGDLRVGAEARDEERLGHRRHVLVREAHVGAARRTRRPASPRRRRACRSVASTIACAAMIFSQSVIGRGGVVIAGGDDLAGEARAVVGEEPAVLDDRRR